MKHLEAKFFSDGGPGTKSYKLGVRSSNLLSTQTVWHRVKSSVLAVKQCFYLSLSSRSHSWTWTSSRKACGKTNVRCEVFPLRLLAAAGGRHADTKWSEWVNRYVGGEQHWRPHWRRVVWREENAESRWLVWGLSACGSLHYHRSRWPLYTLPATHKDGLRVKSEIFEVSRVKVRHSQTPAEN